MFRLDPELERQQVERLRQLRASRDQAAWSRRLGELEQAARGSDNLMPQNSRGMRSARPRVGEISDRLRKVFGEYRGGLKSTSSAAGWPDARRHGRWRAPAATRCCTKCARSVRPPAHKTAALAELVCSNSLKSEQENTAPWLLKEELRRLGSLLIGAIAPERAFPLATR